MQPTKGLFLAEEYVVLFTEQPVAFNWNRKLKQGTQKDAQRVMQLKQVLITCQLNT